MKYVGIQTQQWRNNLKSTLLLILFPCVILGLVWVFFQFIGSGSYDVYDDYTGEYIKTMKVGSSNSMFIESIPWVFGACGIWFLIAYFSNTAMINAATSSKPLERRENKRVYNLVENLCIANNMKMPKVNVINDSSLNAFASGINKKNYTVTLTTGIIEKLNDQELEGVIAHELTHIRNRDVRLLIVSIIFVGIFSFLTQIIMRSMMYGNYSSRRSSNDKGSGAIIMLIAFVLSALGYLITILMRFAISRNREYMADAGSAEMTRNPLALASALRKISADPVIEAVSQSDVAQLFIDNPMKKGTAAFASLFATHPPIEKRIQILEQF